MKLPTFSRSQKLSAITGIGLLTAVLGFGDSFFRFLAPSETDESVNLPQSEEGSDDLTVVHTVEHRSGTQSSDVLSGQDTLIVTSAMAAGEDKNYQLNEFGTSTYELVDGEWVASNDEGMIDAYCAPFPARVLNTTSSYQQVYLSIAQSERGNAIGIGPGERHVWSDVGEGRWLIHDREHNFEYRFDVEHC